MIQTINPYATARTAEIMSRYRPIAPKPEPPPSTSAADTENSAVPSGIRKSPYLSNVWAHLQARPTRTRKRGRSTAFSPPSLKRPRTCLQGLSPAYHLHPNSSSPAKTLSMHAFTRTTNYLQPQISIAPNLVQLKCGLDSAVTTLADSVALPLLYCAAAAHPPPLETSGKGIDLNMSAAADQSPEELDLHLHLHEPVKPCVISPRPVRPIGSSIIVKSIADDPRRQTMTKGPEEVEEAVEAEAAPAIVSDSNNKVRLSNAAYKEMVGQPECCWLERCRGGGGGACRRIGGEVSLQFADSEVRRSMAAFTCAATIEWECEGKKMCVDASCSAVKLVCESKDYQFLWRFNTADQEAASKSDN